MTSQDRPTKRTAIVRREAGALIETSDFRIEGARPAHGDDLPVMAKARGAIVIDVDGNEYVDYFLTRGAGMLGHAEERLVVAVSKAMAKGTDLGNVSESAVRLAELIASRFSSIDRIRFVDSYEQAIMEVVRLGRALTKKHVVIVFDGSHHAWLNTTSIADVTSSAECLSLPYNDIEAVDRVFRERGGEAAVVLVEPIATAYGLIPGDIDWLNRIRQHCDRSEALLIYDEMATALALPPGCDFEKTKPDADVILLGSILGGGLPLVGFGGRKALMGHPDTAAVPIGPCSTNRIAFEGGIATLQCLSDPVLYERLEAGAKRLDQGLRAAAGTIGLATHHVCVGALVGLFFSSSPVTNSCIAQASDRQRYDCFAAGMLERGVLCPPWPYAVWHLSAAHVDEQIDATIESAHEVMQELSHRG